jgi:GTP cyclohydrolase I
MSKKIENLIRELLIEIGENPDRIGLIDTPKRVAKMYEEFFCGYNLSKKPRVMVVPNGEDGVYYDQMLRDEGYFFSFCEHHIIPFFGHYYYGYIPNKKIIGASKIGRLVDYYAGKLQIAERLVSEIVGEIDKDVKPYGQILVMNARHLCKEMRGLKKWNSPFEAIAVTGYFKENKDGCKDEFMSRIQGK